MKIDKDIPIPPPEPKGEYQRYPFEDMEIGDSILDGMFTTSRTDLFKDRR